MFSRWVPSNLGSKSSVCEVKIMIRPQVTQFPHDSIGRQFRQQSCAGRVPSRAGFTLVEMLVSVTLVLLMMVMFGEIFQLATESVTKQRVVADNDQNVRTFVTVIRGDLENRSFRTVVPYYASEPVDGNAFPPLSDREGYFAVSNNSIVDGTDDSLQFTTRLQVTGDERFYGRATRILGTTALDLNQPDRDDGQFIPNEAGASRAAEVAYWVRAGKLYRRVMLIRDPSRPGDDAQPRSTTSPNIFFFHPAVYVNEDANGNGVLESGEDSNSNLILDGNFWGEFDYSTRSPMPPSIAYLHFNGLDSLRNNHDEKSLPFPPPANVPWIDSLGQTWNRFGYNNDIVTDSTLNGMPREFTSTTGNPRYLGRYTHQETSDPRFQHPVRRSYSSVTPPSAGFNPMDANNAVTLNSEGLISEFDQGNRAGVDLLLSNVHEFRVELWDERLNDFAPIGHSRTTAGGIAGDYHINRRFNSTFGPLGGQANVFDTWHPQFNRNANVDAGGNPILGDEPDRPPYRPVTIDPTGFSGPSYTNPSGASLFWAPNTNYQVDDIVFPRMEDVNGNGFLDPGEDGANGYPGNGVLHSKLTEDANGNGMLDPGEDGTFGFPADGQLNSSQPLYFPFGLNVWYRCTKLGRSGPWSYTEPNGRPGDRWRNAGQWSNEAISGQVAPTEDYFGNRNGFFEAWEDLNGNGVNDTLPDEPNWEPVTTISPNGNIRPLRAIRMTVRFEHPTSKQMKQVTIVHSLRDATSVP